MSVPADAKTSHRACLAAGCGLVSGCSRHAALAVVAAGGDPTAAAIGIAALADELRALRAGSPRRELAACGARLAERFTADPSAGAAGLRVDHALRTGRGAPLILGAIAATAARAAGIPLGLLAAPRGRFAVAHAMLSKPLVLDLADGFALRDIAGSEATHRWLCAHETARRVTIALAALEPCTPVRERPPRTTATGTPARRPAPPCPAPADRRAPAKLPG